MIVHVHHKINMGNTNKKSCSIVMQNSNNINSTSSYSSNKTLTGSDDTPIRTVEIQKKEAIEPYVQRKDQDLKEASTHWTNKAHERQTTTVSRSNQRYCTMMKAVYEQHI